MQLTQRGAPGIFSSTKVPAPRKNVAPAAIKIHMLFDLVHMVMSRFTLTPATTHDVLEFPYQHIIRGSLMIFDLGYWDHELLKIIRDQELACP